MNNVVRRSVGFASSLMVEARMLTVVDGYIPTEATLDQLQLTLNQVRSQYRPLSHTDVVWMANVIKTHADVSDTWKTVWTNTHLPCLLPLACLSWIQSVQPWHREATACVEALWDFAAPVALKVSVESAPKFGDWQEAFSFISASSVDFIRRWKPAGGITFLAYIEGATRAELPKGLAALRGRGSQLDQRLRALWAARASLLAYGVDQADISADLVLRELHAQAKARGEELAKSWTLELVTELLQSQYEAAWSLDYAGHDERPFGHTIASTAAIDEDFETSSMNQEAYAAARALHRAGLWPLAMSLPLKDLLDAAQNGTQSLDAFCTSHNLKSDLALEIVDHIGHLLSWRD